MKLSKEDINSIKEMLKKIEENKEKMNISIQERKLTDLLILNSFDIDEINLYKKILKILSKYKIHNSGFHESVLDKIEIYYKKYGRLEEFHLHSLQNHRSKLMYLTSMYSYFTRNIENEKNRKLNASIKPKVGEMYYANLLLGFSGELIFEHPVIVLSVNNDNENFLCLPCTSGKDLPFEEALKEIDENKEMILNKKYTGLDRHTVVLFSELKTLKFKSIYEAKPIKNFLNSSDNYSKQNKTYFNKLKNKTFKYNFNSEYNLINDLKTNLNNKRQK